MDFVKIEMYEIKNYLKNLIKRGKKIVAMAVRNYVNNMAYQTKIESRMVLDEKFNFKSSSTRKYANRFITVTKSKKGLNAEDQVSEVGATGNIDGTSFSARKGGFLARQELGGKVKQIKSGGQGIRPLDMRRNLEVLKPKQSIRINKYIKANGAGKKPFSTAIAVATKRKIPFVSTPSGIFRIFQSKLKYNKRNMTAKFTRKKAQVVYALASQGQTTLKPIKWLDVSTDRANFQRMKIWKKSFDFLEKQLQKK